VFSDNDLRDRLIADASEHVLRFDWADVAERTAEIYTGLIAQQAGQPGGSTGSGQRRA
jgi:glycogen(starch) synthase